jgi:hypothetical protein
MEVLGVAGGEEGSEDRTPGMTEEIDFLLAEAFLCLEPPSSTYSIRATEEGRVRPASSRNAGVVATQPRTSGDKARIAISSGIIFKMASLGDGFRRSTGLALIEIQAQYEVLGNSKS